MLDLFCMDDDGPKKETKAKKRDLYDEVQRMKLLIDQTYRLATVAQQNIYYYVFALLQTNTHSFTHTQRERGNKSREKRTKIHSTPHTLIGLKYTQTYCSYDESQKRNRNLWTQCSFSLRL